MDGVETTKSSVAALARNVGFVFQNPDHQLFSETVEEEIAFALKNFGFETEVIEKPSHLGAELVVVNSVPKDFAFPAQRRRAEACCVGVGFGLGSSNFDFG